MILLYIDIASNDSSIAEMGRKDKSLVHFINWPLGSICPASKLCFVYISNLDDSPSEAATGDEKNIQQLRKCHLML